MITKVLLSLCLFASSTAVLALPPEPQIQQAYCSCDCKDAYGKTTRVLVNPGGNVSRASCLALSGATCGTQDISTLGTLSCSGTITVKRAALEALGIGVVSGSHSDK